MLNFQRKITLVANNSPRKVVRVPRNHARLEILNPFLEILKAKHFIDTVHEDGRRCIAVEVGRECTKSLSSSSIVEVDLLEIYRIRKLKGNHLYHPPLANTLVDITLHQIHRIVA